MSSNRQIYDTCAYKAALERSTYPLSYALYPGKYENCAKCRIELGQLGGNGVSIYSGNMVDLESNLRGQNRPASLCNKYQAQPINLNQVDRQMVHQPACQMVKYHSVPLEPKVEIAQCPQPNASVYLKNVCSN